MGKTIALFCFLVAFVMVSHGQTKDEMEVRNLLAAQAKDWNDGNITSFMNGYWKTDSLMFIGKSGVTYGWQKTMDNYKRNYPDTSAMGKLDFELLEVKRLSVMYYFVVGRWFLTRSIGNIDGAFTLLFRKIKNRWVIVADHSS
ncbi:MAG: nuclear transport factor 2 family protein [Ferruginibacter sp.]|nr:nuclear transport factor 2 family protein [Ferruginibacter sp.]